MRQHVNPLSRNFNQIERIPSLVEIFGDPKLNLHLDIGCASGDFLFDLALVNTSWNYLGIEIRERLVKTAKSKVREGEINNLYFVFGSANKILSNDQSNFFIKNIKSISFNFPDPWFKKRHNKRRIIQPEFIKILSNSLHVGSLIFVKTDVRDLFDYMECIISGNGNFKIIDKDDFNFLDSFNPTKIKTSREQYVIAKQLDIFERIYIKI